MPLGRAEGLHGHGDFVTDRGPQGRVLNSHIILVNHIGLDPPNSPD